MCLFSFIFQLVDWWRRWFQSDAPPALPPWPRPLPLPRMHYANEQVQRFLRRAAGGLRMSRMEQRVEQQVMLSGAEWLRTTDGSRPQTELETAASPPGGVFDPNSSRWVTCSCARDPLKRRSWTFDSVWRKDEPSVLISTSFHLVSVFWSSHGFTGCFSAHLSWGVTRGNISNWDELKKWVIIFTPFVVL